MKRVVAIGDAFGGLDLVGPFDTNGEAIEWAEGLTQQWAVVKLEPKEDREGL